MMPAAPTALSCEPDDPGWADWQPASGCACNYRPGSWPNPIGAVTEDRHRPDVSVQSGRSSTLEKDESSTFVVLRTVWW